MTTKTRNVKIHILDERCKGCGFCVEFCPRHTLAQTKETNPKGYQLVRVVDLDTCTACGMCSRVCPEFAIYIETEKGKE